MEDLNKGPDSVSFDQSNNQTDKKIKKGIDPNNTDLKDLNKSGKKIVKKQLIPFFKLVKFSSKSIFKEVLFYVLNITTIVISIAVGVLLGLTSSGSGKVVIFNFFILFFVCVLMFVFILRMVQFFFHKNFEDKTTYIVLTNQVSRTKFFMAQYFLIILVVFFNVLISFISINIFYFLLSGFSYDLFMLKMTVVYLIYTFLASFFIINFITFLMFIFTLQTTTIICTLLLALSFIANLPMQFTKANEKSYTMQFTTSSGPQLFKVTDVYDAYTLNDNIAKGNIKYPHLSKYLYDYFIEQRFSSDASSFSSNSNIERRINFWNDLGLLKNDQNFTYNGATIAKRPQSQTSWANGNVVNLSFTLDNVFMSRSELDTLIDQNSLLMTTEQINVLKEFREFSDDIVFNSPFGSIETLRYQKYELWRDFIFIKNGKITNTSQNNATEDLDKEGYYSMYVYDVVADTNLVNSWAFNKSYELTESMDFWQLMFSARILENYFVKYSSNYLIMSSNQVATNAADWSTYASGRQTMNWVSYFNLYNGMWMLYTQNVGFYNDDIWFSPNSDSKIYLEEQKNMFLGYPEYTIKLTNNSRIDVNTVNNYRKSWYYLAILGVITLIGFIIAIVRFKKFDFK